MRAAAIALAALLALPCLARDPERQPPPGVLCIDTAEAMTARISREIAAQHIVGISVAMVRDGRIVHTQHFGWEDREKQIPASDATMYRWASISKPLTAIVAMQLWEQGRMDLDGDVRLLVPEFPEPAEQHVITARQLLCHLGGIVHYTNGAVVRTPRPELKGRYLDIIDALDTFKASPLVAVPSEKYSYTTHGYILLGAAVQRAGGEPYPEQVRQRITLPLGMTTLQPDYQWEEIPNRTVGYRRLQPPRASSAAGSSAKGGSDEPGEESAIVNLVVSSNTDVSWKLAGGGWISNITDLALLGAGMLNHQLVKPETRELMWQRQRTASGQQTSYGLGFQISELEGRALISHGGSQEKTRTLLMMLPDAGGGGAAVAIMCNTEGTDLVPMGRDLLGLIATTAEKAGAADKAGGAGESSR
jgi:serine beta-lactamase-like protein LACTB, mitochondrial